MPDYNNKLTHEFSRPHDSEYTQSSISQAEANKLYLDEEYDTYFIEFVGDISEDIKKVDFAM